MIPYSFFSSSDELIADFEDNRQLTRELLRVSSIHSGSSQSFLDGNALERRTQLKIDSMNLLPEQVAGINAITSPKSSPLIPKPIIQDALTVSLKKLNLNEIIDIGYKLQTIHNYVKVTGIKISENPELKGYFDVLYTLNSLSMKQESKEPEPSTNRKRKRRSNTQGEA